MAKTQREWPLREIEWIAGQLVEEISETCEQIVVAGSIRRRRPIIHDVDIVCVSQVIQVQADLFGGMAEVSCLDERLSNMGVDWTGGDKIHRFEYEGASIDLYVCDKSVFALALLIRTGSQEHNQYLCELANKKGYSISYSQGVRAGNEIIAIEREDDLFSLLGLDYVLPERREAKPWPGHYPRFKPEWWPGESRVVL